MTHKLTKMRYFSTLVLFVLLTIVSFCFIQNPGGPIKKTKAQKEAGVPTFCKASPLPTEIVQSDGSTLPIVGKGNLNNYWTEIEDG